jgi:hypothetical protein
MRSEDCTSHGRAGNCVAVIPSEGRPEFFGNIILVNGMAWPSLAVEPRKYRFHILNGSNARMYNLRLVNQSTRKVWKHVWQIGSDGGYLTTPVRLVQSAVHKQNAGDRFTKLFLAPAERADVIALRVRPDDGPLRLALPHPPVLHPQVKKGAAHEVTRGDVRLDLEHEDNDMMRPYAIVN